MLTRSDITILMQQVDVTKAFDLLAMFKEAGKERIDIRTILDEAAGEEPVLGVFQETTVGAPLALGVDAVAVVDEDLHS